MVKGRMNSNREQRILIALDTQYANGESLSLLVTLAKRLNATLTGLFVENSQLMEVANLPFTTEINRFSAEEKNFQRETLTRLNRQFTLETQRQIQRLSEKQQVSWSYSVETGELITKALSYEGFDIFFPGRTASIQSLSKITKAKGHKQLTLLYDQSPQFEKILNIVGILAGNHLHYDVTVLCDREPPHDLQETLANIRQVHFQVFTYNEPLSISTLKLPVSALLLAPKDKFLRLPANELNELMNYLPCSILLID
jgi:hypothetical protein